MVVFDKYDKENWLKFRNNKSSTLTNNEFVLICELHAKYYNHRFYKPCTCSPKKIKLWIKQLNVIWDNGDKQD